MRRGAVRIACGTCGDELERPLGRSLDAALGCAAATLILLVPANLAPLLTTSALGATRTSHLASSAEAMWRDGRPWVGIAVALFLVFLPIIRFSMLAAVLVQVRTGRVTRGTGRAFRWERELEPWAMADVFLLALVVTVARLQAALPVRLETGAYCFAAAGILTLITRATLDRRAVWEAILPSIPPVGPTVCCPACDLAAPVAQAGGVCPRCSERLEPRRHGAVRRATALTAAGLLLYLPANIFPIATLPVGFTPLRYTVLEGVRDLFANRLYGLAALVFCASFLIPILKLTGMAWCVNSVLTRSRRRLRLKTRSFRVIEEIGRWSMIDPFVIGAFVPVTQYNDFIYGRAEPAAAAFTGVVVTTMLAARFFDPRLMWDAAEARA